VLKFIQRLEWITGEYNSFYKPPVGSSPDSFADICSLFSSSLNAPPIIWVYEKVTSLIFILE
jgi:hypothetical protein